VTTASTRTNRQWRLAERPAGIDVERCFRLDEEPAPDVAADDQIVVRNLVFSLDPTQRGWIARDTYMPAVKIGAVMRSFAVGRVEQSRSADYAVGDLVSGMFGWQDYVLVDAKSSPPTKLLPGVPIELAMSVLGATGLTAFFGLLDVGRPKSGETVVVSGAAGATGSIAAQIARIHGCRTIGIAGGREKCDWLLKDCRLDASVDYKSEDVSARLRELCPSGIDVYFDNVGGDTLDVALAQLALRGRIVLCGAIAAYGDDVPRSGPKNYMNLISRRGRMEGFLILDYLPRFAEGAQKLWQWVRNGEIAHRVDVQHGFENAPRTLKRLFLGENVGKQLLRIAD
jgi:NADPH-dependent curcumin reductase CurA